MACPNTNSQQWKDLVAKIGVFEAMKEFIKNGEEIPDASNYQETFKGVNATLKIVNALQKIPRTSYPSNSTQGFYNDLIKQGAPKNQIELLKEHIAQHNITDINTNDLITSLLSEMSYTIEINTVTKDMTNSYREVEPIFGPNGEIVREGVHPTQYYSSMTVPGGTNYTENEIATPAIVPSIKGHGQFSTDNGIGWFRSDDKTDGSNLTEGEKRTFSHAAGLGANFGLEATKTRRILEVQSDLFQKGRSLNLLVPLAKTNKYGFDRNIPFIYNDYEYSAFPDENLYAKRKNIPDTYTKEYQWQDINKDEYEKALSNININIPSNNFLQLLNKDNNWVTFFVKSIIQDSAKKGYEKVLFPSGDTAAKVEGHQTLESLRQITETRIAELEYELIKVKSDEWVQGIIDYEFENGEYDPEEGPKKGTVEGYRKSITSRVEYELKERKRELDDIINGRTKLSTIHAFYETIIANILKKQGYKPTKIIDEYGNEWNEVALSPSIANDTIMFQLPGTEGSKASSKTLSLVSKWLERIGVERKDLPQYDLNGQKIDANGQANLLNDMIRVAQGKEDVALTEEAMHFAVAIMKQTNPQLFKQMMNKIGSFNYYKQIYNEYSKKYTLPDGRPDVLKIKEEAVGKILAEYLIRDTEGATEKPELLGQALTWWQQIKDFFLSLIGKATFNPFETAVKELDKIEDTKSLDAPYKELADRIMSYPPKGIQGYAAQSAYKQGRYRAVVSMFSEQLEDSGTYQTIIDSYLGGDEQLAQDILKAGEVFLQTAPQTETIFDKINKKIADFQLVKRTDKADPDDENSNSYYTVVIDGKERKADRTTSWADRENIRRNGGKDYFAGASPEKQKIWAQKAMSGTNGHLALEAIITHNLLPDGTLKPKEEWSAPDTTLVAHPIYVEMVRFLLGYKVPVTGEIKPGFLDQFPVGSKFGVEKMLYNEKGVTKVLNKKTGKVEELYGRASTTDLLVLLPDDSIKIYDWKFMGFLLQKPDQAPQKKSQHALQLGDYKKTLREVYGVKKVDAYTIPIHAEYVETPSDVKLKSVTFGAVNFKDEKRTSLLPVIPAGQSSGNPQVDQLVASLEAHYKKIYSRKEDPQKKFEKIEQLQQLSNAIRNLQVALNFDPLAAEALNFQKNSERALEKYQELDFTGLDEETLTKQLDELIEMFHSAETYSKLDEVFLSEYDETGLNEDSQKTLATLRIASSRAKSTREQVLDKLRKYVSYIAQKEGVDNILSPTLEVTGMLNTMIERGSILLPMANLAVQRALDKRSKDKQIVAREINKFGELYAALETLAKRTGKKAFQLIGDGNSLIKKVKSEFWTELNTAFEKQNKEFILKNIDQEAFNKELEEIVNKRIALINDTIYTTNPKDNKERQAYYITALKRAFNIYDTKNFNGWNDRQFTSLVKRHVVEEPHWTDEYRNLHKAGNEAALAMHTYLYEMNKKAFSYGYLERGDKMTFFPMVTGTMLERLAQGSSTTGTLSDIFSDIYKVDASEEQAFGKTNPETGALEKTVPKLFKHTNKTDEALSKDLLKVIPLYIRALQEYSTSKDLEMEMLTYEMVERAKGHLESEASQVIFDAEGPKVFKGNENNANILKDMNDWLVYGIRESSNTFFDSIASRVVKGTDEEKKEKVLSAKKALTGGNMLTQSLAVGLKVLVAVPNYVGAHMQSIINAGLYYTPWEYEKAHNKIVWHMLSDMDKGLIDMIVPLNDDVVRAGQRKLAWKQSPLKWLSTWTFQEFMMSTNQFPDMAHQLSNAKSFNDNAMVVDGQIVNIKQYLLSQPEYQNRYKDPSTLKQKERELNDKIKELKETKSLPKIAKFNEQGILEIPGVSQEALAKYRTAVSEYARKITGQMSQENAAKYRQDILVKSFMMFKNWIPKQVALRTLDIKKNPALDQWEYGRTRLFIKTLSQIGYFNIKGMRDIIQATPAGIEKMKEMVDRKREEYYKKTGLELTISDEEFYDMVRKELSAQAKELVILLSILGLVLAAKLAAPDDDDDPLAKNRYKFWAKAINKISDEIWFYYNPTSAESITRGSIFPSLGLLTKAEKTIRNAGKDLFYYTQGDEEGMEKTHTLKYFFNMVPVASQFQNELLPYLYPEAAKEWGIRVTEEARAMR